MRAIGTNAIPTLLRLLNAEDSKFKLQLLQLAEKQRVINLHPKRTEFRRFEAKFGLICLGPEAKSAVPVLMEIYREHRPGPYDDPRSIAEIFTAIGPAAADAVPLLVQDTTNTDLLISCCAVQTLGEIHARPELTVPTLTMSLHGPGESIRALAAQGLAAFGGDARAAVPDLVIALSDPSSRVSAMAASALKQINRDPSAAQSAADPFTFKYFQ